MLRWYGQVMGAEIRHQNDFLAFMAFDDEHHRMVIFTVPVRDSTMGAIRFT